jgi:hypothetical protein
MTVRAFPIADEFNAAFYDYIYANHNEQLDNDLETTIKSNYDLHAEFCEHALPYEAVIKFRNKVRRMTQERQCCMFDFVTTDTEEYVGCAGLIKINRVKREAHMLYLLNSAYENHFQSIFKIILNTAASLEICLKYVNCQTNDDGNIVGLLVSLGCIELPNSEGFITVRCCFPAHFEYGTNQESAYCERCNSMMDSSSQSG